MGQGLADSALAGLAKVLGRGKKRAEKKAAARPSRAQKARQARGAAAEVKETANGNAASGGVEHDHDASAGCQFIPRSSPRHLVADQPEHRLILAISKHKQDAGDVVKHSDAS